MITVQQVNHTTTTSYCSTGFSERGDHLFSVFSQLLLLSNFIIEFKCGSCYHMYIVQQDRPSETSVLEQLDYLCVVVYILESFRVLSTSLHNWGGGDNFPLSTVPRYGYCPPNNNAV